MLTLEKADSTKVISTPVEGRPIEDLLTKEWLLTNERGSYASSTIVSCNTRRYHGLLIASIYPLTNRIMGLANCLEMVIANGKVLNLATFEFNGKFNPEGFRYIKNFRQDTGVHFDFQLDKLRITKSLYLLHDTDKVALVYDFANVERPTEFVLRPFVGLRDFHSLQKSYAPLFSEPVDDGLAIRHNVPDSCELLLKCPSMNFAKDQQWWFNFVYREDKERGQEYTEDLWSPGFFKCCVDAPAKIVLWANLRVRSKPESATVQKLADAHPQQRQVSCPPDLEAAHANLREHQNKIISLAKTKDKRLRILFMAADQFVAKRNSKYADAAKSPEPRTTILAGFPWFADWGRDAFIALPGLLLSTGRFDDAKSVLTTFGAAVDEGMIPNRFDDYSDTAYFNSVDASLWFINAAFQYLYAAGDSETFGQKLLPTIRWIIDSYSKGTRYGIAADTDGLISAGDDQTQLTWMDAKYDGVAITARHGKAIEINALWYNSLCWLTEFYAARQDMETAKRYQNIAEKVSNSLCRLFWNGAAGYLNDRILPDGSTDTTLRPNQVFAVSLPFSPLPHHQQAAVVEVLQRNLLTPYGLRTLSAQDNRYRGQYTGPQKQRDNAYHQGTVWPYLIGPFVEAYLKVNNFSRKSKKRAAEFIEPLVRHVTEDGCLGQVCEIFDGDPPHKPKGCIAQAWSVAELIRAYQLING